MLCLDGRLKVDSWENRQKKKIRTENRLQYSTTLLDLNQNWWYNENGMDKKKKKKQIKPQKGSSTKTQMKYIYTGINAVEVLNC